MWQVDHQCPQCGASANLQETERLFACPFCRVKLYIASSGACRYFLPPPAADADETIFVPYWRFKGMYFYFGGADIEAGIIDVSHNATPLDMLPSSLGLRSQTLKLKFLSPEIKGSFLEPACSLQDALSTVEKSSEPGVPSFSERTFIGDSAGMIYSPICIRKNTAYDGILGKEIAALPDAVCRELAGEHKKPQWRIAFIPSLCPDCGWDLNGEPESIVLTCRNCLSAWGAAESGFERVPCSFLSMRGDDLLYLPFWRIETEIAGISLNTYADFIRLSNLPKPAGRELEETPLAWLAPAFKINPNQYLKLSQRMTLARNTSGIENDLPGGAVHPVTLPLKESFESLKMVLAYSAASKKDVALNFREITFVQKSAGLIYWPFYTSRMELIRRDRQLSIPVNALKWGRKI